MNIGLRQGSRGKDIARLHRVLSFAGFPVEAAEIESAEFGPSTLRALRALLSQRDVPRAGEVEAIDIDTQSLLLEIERTIIVVEPAPAGSTDEPGQPPSNPHEGIVHGILVDGDGAPIAGALVTLIASAIRTQTTIGHAHSGKTGQYKIHYRRTSAVNLSVKASDASGKLLATSATVFAAAADIEIDLTSAPDGVVRTPSLYTVLTASIAAYLGSGLKLTDLKENKDAHELTFLANAIQVPFLRVASLYVAQNLAALHNLEDMTLFGLFARGTPVALAAGLQSLPDAGIDASFCGSVFTALLASDRASLNALLTAAVSKNVLPASYSSGQSAQLDLLDTLRQANVASQPFIRGKTPLSDLLSAGIVTEAVQTAFIAAYAANGGRIGSTWTALKANKNLPAADLATLDTVLNAGDLLNGNLLLVKDTMARLSNKSLATISQLAMLDEADWEQRVRSVDPEAASIPPVLPNETPAQRITRFAKALTHRFAGRYPTMAFAGGLAKATTTSFASRDELVSFLTASPTFSLHFTSIDSYLLTNKLQLSPAAAADLKTAQRLHRVSPHYTSVEALVSAGHKSAQSIYFQGRAPFLASMTASLGSADLAETAFARAQMIYSSSLLAFSQYNRGFTGVSTAALSSPTPAPGTLDNLPDLQALFGSLDSFQCDDCQSVLSPAAYLVDLLQYLKQFGATPLTGGTPSGVTPLPAGINNAQQALLLRRPEIAHVALSCANTNVIIPYIDLVNEILEAAIAPPATPLASIDTTGTTAQRRAIPQQTQPAVSSAAYALTKGVSFPLKLPFDVDFARTTAYIAALGTTRLALLNLFPTPATATAGAVLGINSAMQAIIATQNLTDPWVRWGLNEQPSTVIDPKTRTSISLNPNDWTTALNNVPVLLSRSGLTLQQLYQLLEVVWVTQSNVTLQLGKTTMAGLPILDPNTDSMQFTNLTGDVLDRATRFLRLWAASGLQMWELDWALELPQVKNLDDPALSFLAGAITVQKQLSLPFQEVLTFWPALIETRDVVSHLGEEDAVIPSTYTLDFGNPTMVAAFPSFQPAPPATGGAAILVPGQPQPSDLIPLNGISAALGLSSSDISAILSATGAENNLNLTTLTVLDRYATLATALSLTVPDLILYIALTQQQPFGGSPADTLEFLRRLAVLRSTSIAVHDLDYLLRGQSAAQTALAVTAVQTTTFLQTVQAAVAKAISASQIAISAVTDATPIVITTAKPHGLAVGSTAQVFVSGVLGDTAANGSFAASVTSPSHLTLTGSAQNGTWTGGGGVITSVDSLSATVSNIVLATIVAATGSSANVISPVLTVNNAVTIDPATLTLLLATPSPQPGAFPALVAAYSRASMAAALCNALSADPGAFAFLCLNSQTFGWLSPATLPLAPAPSSNYSSFETMLRALKLQGRQAALTPKLFDVFTQWIHGPVPAQLDTTIGGPLIQVTGASAATPIVVTTQNPHNLQSGAQITISGIEGNAAANGNFTIAVTGPDTFSLNGTSSTSAWTSGGSVVVLNAPTIAFALNAQDSDVQAIASALNAQPPSLILTTQPGTLADIATLTSIANALDVMTRYGIEGSTLVHLAASVPSSDTSNAAMGALQAQYPQASWLAAVQPVEDNLRQQRRDALVAYLLGPGPAVNYAGSFLFTDDIFDYYLIDAEMCACGETTRLLQPSLAIQQFVQQIFLNLTVGVTVDTTNSTLWAEWSWRSQFQMWVANREVFLYPENYVLPELRSNASSFFSDLESDLRQSNCDADAAQAAFENYLRKLAGVARLVVAAHYNQTNSDGSVVLHVFAHTRGTPPQWFYRTRTTLTPGTIGTWTAWESVNLDIPDGQLVPVVWDQRLYLIWPMFKQCSEKSSDQKVPASGGNTQPPAHTFWSVQFAMSEFSAGQWQAKRLLDEKMYLDTQDPPASFLFKAFQDSGFNLQILVFYTSSSSQLSVTNLEGAGPWGDTESFDVTILVAQGTLAYPDAPLSIVQIAPAPSGSSSLPGIPLSSIVDLSQEPTYSLITIGLPTNDDLDAAQLQYTPIDFSYKGQDLVYGGWTNANPGNQTVSVLYMTGRNIGLLGSQKLLGQMNNPRIVVPQNELIFDSMDPFFVADGSRTYLVQPEYFTVANYPKEIEVLNQYIQNWTIKYVFETFYHPYARTLLRELEVGGISHLMSRNLQTNPQSAADWPAQFNFQTLFHPEQCVATPYPGQTNAPDPGESLLDFDPGCGGAYSLYNWEVFYHGPMFVASLLIQNQQFQDTLTWYEYIFNPSDNTTLPAPARFWEFAPFYTMNATNASAWNQQEIDQFLLTLAADTAEHVSNDFTTSAANAINAWMEDPYDPHMVASTRISTYAKATVMKFLDNLLAWGDSLYAQYTSETVSQAEQLYIFADLILGPQPDQLRMPSAQQTAAPTYASLQNIDPFSNVLVNVENLVVAPEPPQSLVQGTGGGSSLPQLPGNGNTLLFCVPPNDQLLAYWGSVALRLYNIRHCLNMQGVPQPLPLYAPPINPLQLIAEQASGAGFSSTQATAPIYRFITYLQKAVELTNEVRSYGSAILAALEKQDAETLAALRATQEVNIQTMTLDVKNRQLTEAQDQVTVLVNQKAVTQLRYNFYSSQAFMNTWEILAIGLQGAALIANGVGLILDMTSGTAHLGPSISFGMAGFGGSPMGFGTYGGQNIGHSTASWANVARTIGGLLSEGGGMAATMGGYQRRQDDWTFQANTAQAELTQIASQITAANDRVGIANSEVNIQTTQIANAQAISNFLTNKYTNARLYNWMVTQLTTVYTQAYQLAYSLALQAQAAYQYELGRLDSFIGFAYWDGQHRGLTAGESLLFDLRRMESQYIANNLRELEVTMHISLALTQPTAVVQLLQSGSCTINLDETVFDRAYPGHYFRRLRSVALTIPCVTGPYTGVHATLMLSSSVVRTVAPTAGYTPFVAGGAMPDGVFASSAVAATPIIATSSGQNDAGLFDVNLRDERWLPFEGQGAVSTWSLSLDARDNDFDLSTITDVIVHLRYTARFGGNAELVREALAKSPNNQRTILVSTRSTFSNAYFTFFFPTDVTSTDQTLVLPLTANVFPFSVVGTPKITDIAIYFVLAEQAVANISGGSLDATFAEPGAAPAAQIKFIPMMQPSGSVGGVAALQADSPYSASSAAQPGIFTLTVPQSSLQGVPKLQVEVSGQARLDIAQFDDIVLIISYEIP